MNETAMSNLLIFINIIIGIVAIFVVVKFFALANDVKEIKNQLLKNKENTNSDSRLPQDHEDIRGKEYYK